MSLYYPPLTGTRGEKASDWPTGVIPSNLANAILSAVQVGKEPIFDSGSGWLIMDGDGNPPGEINRNLWAWSQDPTNRQIKKEPLTITVSGGRTIPQSKILPIKGWFAENWKWAVPVGVGILIILMSEPK